jgi:hypothetical protein
VTAATATASEFALLLEPRHEADFSRRMIITGRYLYELPEVGGYHYLSLSPEGEPFHRCRTPHLGGRAFFDGTRLMRHQSFTTCSPDVIFFPGGYMVDSNDCTIVNGMLYPLITPDLVPRHMSSAILSDHKAEHQARQQLALRLNIQADGTIVIGDHTVQPIGIFHPSERVLQKSGFTRYEWSEFVEL